MLRWTNTYHCKFCGAEFDEQSDTQGATFCPSCDNKIDLPHHRTPTSRDETEDPDDWEGV